MRWINFLCLVAIWENNNIAFTNGCCQHILLTSCEIFTRVAMMTSLNIIFLKHSLYSPAEVITGSEPRTSTTCMTQRWGYWKILKTGKANRRRISGKRWLVLKSFRFIITDNQRNGLKTQPKSPFSSMVRPDYTLFWNPVTSLQNISGTSYLHILYKNGSVYATFDFLNFSWK